jgi:outer membrane protein assembly factor BamB/Spy/CpxP family protein refolding chaperone
MIQKEFEMAARWTFVLVISVVWLPAFVEGSDWPQFRGPNGSATSTEASLPDKWGADQHIAWKAKLPGYGWSSPIIVGDKVFVTTAVTANQRKPSGGFGGGRGGFGGPGEGGPGDGQRPGRGRPGGFGGPPQAGQILPTFLQDRLNLTDAQKKQVDELQKEVDGKLGKILTDDQKKQLKEPPTGGARGGFGRGGPGGRGPGGFGGPPQPGQLLPGPIQERLKLTADQKKQLDDLQKDVDGKLAKVITEEQQKQLKDMQAGGGRGGFARGGGRGGPGGPGGFGGRGQRAPDAMYKWEIYCLSAADGKVLWKQTAAEQKPKIPAHASNTYATETPATDGERVYAYFGMTGVFCYDLAGKLLWKEDLGSYRVAMGYGTGSSPVVADGRLFVQCDNEEKSFLVALDAKTGKQLWRVERPERTSWSTPLVWKNKVRTEIVCIGNPRVRSYDPATGKQLWELGGLNGQIKASPVASSELLYVGTGGGFGGFGGPGGVPGGEEPGDPVPAGRGGRGGRGAGGKPLFAVKAGASGDITLKDGAKSNDGVAWFLPQAGPSTASPLLVGAQLYILEERNGLLSCYNAKTGKQVYKERLSGARGFTSSPWAYDGKVFCLDDSGTTHVVQAGPTFKLLGKNSLNEMCWSSPAVAGGSLLVRTVDHLFCIKP